MNIELATLINELTKLKNINEDLYNLTEFNEKLEMVDSISISIGDSYVILPFYFCDKGTYEIHWCELTVKSVDTPSFEDHVLEKTGRGKINEVNEAIVERMKNIYLEIVQPETTLQSSSIMKCVSYIKNSEEVIEDITSAFIRYDKQFQFDENCLYFAVY